AAGDAPEVSRPVTRRSPGAHRPVSRTGLPSGQRRDGGRGAEDPARAGKAPAGTPLSSVRSVCRPVCPRPLARRQSPSAAAPEALVAEATVQRSTSELIAPANLAGQKNETGRRFFLRPGSLTSVLACSQAPRQSALSRIARTRPAHTRSKSN